MRDSVPSAKFSLAAAGHLVTTVFRALQVQAPSRRNPYALARAYRQGYAAPVLRVAGLQVLREPNFDNAETPRRAVS